MGKSFGSWGKLILAIPLLMLLQGFTLDYEVLSECEKRHPHDFLARIVCNGKVEDEFREAKSLGCVYDQRKVLVEKYRQPIHDFLIYNGNATIEQINAELNTRGYESTIQRRESNGLPVIVFTKSIQCKTKAKLLFNIRFDKELRVDHLAAWISYPENFSYGGWLSEFYWKRQDNEEKIQAAIKQQVQKDREVKNNSQGDNLSEGKLNIPNASARNPTPANLDDKSSSFSFGTIILLIGITALLCLVAFIFYQRNRMARLTARLKAWSHVKSSQESGAHTHSRDEDSSRSNEIASISSFESYSPTEREAIKKFRAEYPFVQVLVPPHCATEFLSESQWYKEKVGVYPGIQEQIQILNEIQSSKQ